MYALMHGGVICVCVHVPYMCVFYQVTGTLKRLRTIVYSVTGDGNWSSYHFLGLLIFFLEFLAKMRISLRIWHGRRIPKRKCIAVVASILQHYIQHNDTLASTVGYTPIPPPPPHRPLPHRKVGATITCACDVHLPSQRCCIPTHE